MAAFLRGTRLPHKIGHLLCHKAKRNSGSRRNQYRAKKAWLNKHKEQQQEQKPQLQQRTIAPLLPEQSWSNIRAEDPPSDDSILTPPGTNPPQVTPLIDNEDYVKQQQQDPLQLAPQHFNAAPFLLPNNNNSDDNSITRVYLEPPRPVEHDNTPGIAQQQQQQQQQIEPPNKTPLYPQQSLPSITHTTISPNKSPYQANSHTYNGGHDMRCDWSIATTIGTNDKNNTKGAPLRDVAQAHMHA